ncbi:MAG: MarR family transcriptional regulator [Campylobacteraceae bacterium]|nr:MarR family transcriptional regulator [Campylobacteraceae bacterium]
MSEILREIGMIARCLSTISDIEFKDLNLAKGQYLYLVRVYENPGIIQEKLASLLKVDRTTTAKSVKKLIETGYIKKVKTEENKKEFKLFCTKKGENTYSLLKKEEEHTASMSLGKLSQKDKNHLLKMLSSMRINIEEEWIEIKKGNRRDY